MSDDEIEYAFDESFDEITDRQKQPQKQEI